MQLADPLATVGLLADPVDLERLGDDRPRGHPRVEAGVRVLEDHLHPASRGDHLLPVERGQVDAVDQHATRRRLEQPDDGPSRRRLAAPGLAHQPERLAAAHRERDPVDGPDVADVALDDEPVADREEDLEVLDLEQRRAVAAAAAPGAPAAPTRRQQPRRRPTWRSSPARAQRPSRRCSGSGGIGRPPALGSTDSGPSSAVISPSSSLPVDARRPGRSARPGGPPAAAPR